MTVAALRNDLAIEVVGLVTAVTPIYDRISIHGIRRTILNAQSRALGLPVFEAELTPGCSNADYEASWASAIERARESLGPVDAIAYGDLFLEDIRAFRERQLTPLNIQPLFPLWGQPTDRLAREFVDSGFEAYLTCVDTTQLDPSFAGRRFDSALLADLNASVDPCGERGEFHSCVVAGPIFSAPIAVRRGESILRDERFQFCDFELIER
jgi:uncharacterized protein (TIGR00290 family)